MKESKIETLILNKIPKEQAVNVYTQMLLNIANFKSDDSIEKAKEEVIQGFLIKDGQYLIEIKTDNFGRVFEGITLKNNKVVKYSSYQRKNKKLYQFSDSESEQFSELKFFIK